MARPQLRRSAPSPFLESGGLCYDANAGTVSALAPDAALAQELARTVLRAYANQPIHGPSLVLPGGCVATDDVPSLRVRGRPRARTAPPDAGPPN